MDNKKKVAAAIAATIAASGAAVDASIDDPAEILRADANIEPQVQYVGHDADQEQDADKQKAASPERRGGLQDLILQLPLGIRVLIVLPLWCVGAVLSAAGSLLIAGLSPVMNWIIGFAFIALVIAAAYTAAVKAIFPDLPIRKILNRHTIKGILIAAAAVWLADIALGICWAGYAHYKALFIGLFTLAAIGTVVIRFARREHRRREAAEKEERARSEEGRDLEYTSLGQTFTVRPPRQE